MVDEVRVVVPGDMGKTIEFGTTEPDKWNIKHDESLVIKEDGSISVAQTSSGGLDCAAINNLPQKAWKKGTTVLAQQNGNCIRLAPNESLFQEIGVGITANKTVGDIGDKYHLVVTVTNTGEDTNEMTLLDIIKPQLGNYTMSNFTNRASAGASVEKVTDTQYKIKKLAKGGTAIVEFDVTPNASGTFQFGASVNPNTALDMQSNNNQASIILSARVAVNPDITPSVDCPLIDITYKGKKLVGYSSYVGSAYSMPPSNKPKPVNIVSTKDNLNGLSFDIKGDVTVAVQGENSTYFTSNALLLSNNHATNYYGDFEGFENASDNVVIRRTVAYTYSNNKLVINADCNIIRISVRPKGQNCKWQHFDISAAYEVVKKVSYATGLPHKTTDKLNYHPVTDRPDERAVIFAKITVIDGDATPVEWLYSSNTAKVFKEEQLTITLPGGKVTSGRITVTGTVFRPVDTKGNLQVKAASSSTEMTVNTTTNISSADNLSTNDIKFEVV